MTDKYVPVRPESSGKKRTRSILDCLKDLPKSDSNTDRKSYLDRVNADNQRLDKEMEQRQKLMHFRSNTGLTEKDQEKTFDKMVVTCNEFAHVVEYAQVWDRTCDFGLFIHGQPGNGKTHIMKAIAIANANSKYVFRFRTVSDVMDQLKDWENREFYHTELTAPDALILDDLGTEKASEYEQNQLFRILEHRKELGKHIFMTSNKTLEEIKAQYHPRIFSRLGELMVFVDNKAPSYRNFINAQHRDEMKKRIMARRNGENVVQLGVK